MTIVVRNPSLLFISLALASAGCGASASAVPDTPASSDHAASLSPGDTAALLLDLPRAEEWTGVQSVLTIDLLANGQSSIDGKMIRSDRDLLVRIQEASAGYPDLRAVVRADSSVPYGRVIHALDLLKQSGIGRIAFAVTPEGGGAAPPPGTSAAGEEAGAAFLGGQFWNCPYPEAADAEAISAGAVTLIVAVDANGKARWVRLLRDPGYGFGQAAAQCVMAMQFRAARGKDGAPLPGMTPPIRIQFSR